MSQLGKDMLNISKRTKIRFYFTDWQLSMSFAGKPPATSLLALLIWKPQFLWKSFNFPRRSSKWTNFPVSLRPCWSPARTGVNSTWVELYVRGLAGWRFSWREQSKPGWEDQDAFRTPWLPSQHRLPVGVFSTHNLVPEELLSSKNVPILPVTVAYKPARSSPKEWWPWGGDTGVWYLQEPTSTVTCWPDVMKHHTQVGAELQWWVERQQKVVQPLAQGFLKSSFGGKSYRCNDFCGREWQCLYRELVKQQPRAFYSKTWFDLQMWLRKLNRKVEMTVIIGFGINLLGCKKSLCRK